jgi:predicted alpha/beta superfamily hydrolase
MREQRVRNFNTIDGSFEVYLYHLNVSTNEEKAPRRIAIYATNLSDESTILHPKQVILTEGARVTKDGIEAELGRRVFAKEWDRPINGIRIEPGEQKLIGYSNVLSSETTTDTTSTSDFVTGLLRADIRRVTTKPVSLQVDVVAVPPDVSVEGDSILPRKYMGQGARSHEGAMDLLIPPPECHVRRVVGVYRNFIWKNHKNKIDNGNSKIGARKIKLSEISKSGELVFQMALPKVQACDCPEQQQTAPMLLYPPYIHGDTVGNYMAEYYLEFEIENDDPEKDHPLSVRFGKQDADIGLVWQATCNKTPISADSLRNQPIKTEWAGGWRKDDLPDNTRSFFFDKEREPVIPSGETYILQMRLMVLGSASLPWQLHFETSPNIKISPKPNTEAINSDMEKMRIKIIATVPANAGDVYITGNHPAIGNWNPKRAPLMGEGTERHIELDLKLGTELEFKFTQGSWATEAVDSDGSTPANHQITVGETGTHKYNISKFKSGDNLEPQQESMSVEEWLDELNDNLTTGTVNIYRNVASSRGKIRPRHVLVWLPPGYDSQNNTKYQVLYMHDGQNLFHPGLSISGEEWHVDTTLGDLIASGKVPPTIVVGAFSTLDRLIEYSPEHRGPDYARFMVEELKPMIDRKYRTFSEREKTFVMGSSMGGLISSYILEKYGDIFGSAGCVSTHFIWNNGLYHEQFIQSDTGFHPQPIRLYLDHGTEGLDALYSEKHQQFINWLELQGYKEDQDFNEKVFEGHDHTERDWAARLEDILIYLLSE